METVRTPFPKGSGRFGGQRVGLGWKKQTAPRGGAAFRETNALKTDAPSRQERIAYGALLLFVALVYITPGTLYPPLENFPIAKGVAVVSFLFLFFGMRARGASWRLTDSTSLWLIAFTLLGGLSITTALWREYALSAFFDFLKVVLVYFLILHLLDRLDRVHRFLWIMLGGGMVLALGTLTHYVLQINLDGGYRASWIGVYEDPNDLAYNLVVLVPIGLSLLEAERSFAKKGLLLGILATFMAAIYVTFSRGALVALMVVFFFQVLRSRNRMLHFSLAAILLMALLAVAPAHYWERAETILKFRQDESAMGRIYAWQAGFSMVQDRPLLGVGIGCFVMGWPIYAPPEAGTKWRAPHNTFVAVMGETGLLGLVAFGAFMGTALWKVKKVNPSNRPAPLPLVKSASLIRKTGPMDVPAVTEEDQRAALYARGVEIALWGFLACSLTLGVQRSWPPYLFTGLAVVLYTMRAVQTKAVEGGVK